VIVGVPVQLPGEAVSVFSSLASPEIVGRAVLAGAEGGTVAVRADATADDATLFSAVNFNLIVSPTC